MWFERFLNLFKKAAVPEDTQALFREANSATEVLSGLDGLVTRNEVALKDLEKEMHDLEGLEDKEVVEIRSGRVDGRSRRNALRRIQRLRKQMDALEERIKIHNANINLNMKLMGKVQAIQAMEMRGLEEEQVDSILLDFEAQVEEYAGAMRAGDLVDSHTVSIDPDADRELDDLEAEILGKKVQAVGAPDESQQEPEKSGSGTLRGAEPAGGERVSHGKDLAPDVERPDRKAGEESAE